MNDPEPLIQKNGNAPRRVEFDEFSFDTNKKLLRRGAEIVSLAPKACELLNALIANAPEVLSKEELMDLVWADTFVEESNLSQHISALRKALGEDKNGKRFIETIPRKGYRFVAPIAEADDGAAEIVVSERTQTRLSEEIEVEAQELSPPPPENIAQTKAISPSAPTARKNRRKTWLAGAFAVVVLSAFGYAVYQFGNRAAANFVAGKTTRLTTSGRVKSAAVSPDGKFVIYAQEELDDRQTLHLKHIGSESDTEITIPNVAEFRGLSISPDGNQFYFINEKLTLYQVPVLGGMPKKIAEQVNSSANLSSKNIAFSPDGAQIAFVRRFADETGELFIADANGGSERRLASFDTSILFETEPAWSPDGKVIVCPVTIAGSGNILAFQVADGAYTKLISESWVGFRSPVWSSDSRSLLVIGSKVSGSNVSQIWQISYPSGAVRQITNDSSSYRNLNLTVNNNFLTAIRTEAAANIWTMPANAANAARQLTTGFEKTDGLGLGWLPSGEIYYESISSGNSTVWVSQPDGGNPRRVLKGVEMGSASPDGHYLVYQRDLSETNVGLWQMDLSDGTEKKITQGVDTLPTFSPDGKWIVFTRYDENQVALFKVPSVGGEPKMIFNEYLLAPVISPDGKTIAVEHSTITLINFESGAMIKRFDIKPERSEISILKKLQWTADGKGIYFISRASGASNIWRQPVDESSAPVQITDFKDGKIFNFAFSPDESQIALSRGVFNSDVVLIENGK